MDAQVFDIGRRSGTIISGGHDAPWVTGHEYGEKSKNHPLQYSKRAGEREQTQGSAKLERASRTLPHLCITIVLVGGTQTDRRHWGGRNRENSKEIHVRSSSWFLFWYTRNEHYLHHAEHTTQMAP